MGGILEEEKRRGNKKEAAKEGKGKTRLSKYLDYYPSFTRATTLFEAVRIAPQQLLCKQND